MVNFCAVPNFSSHSDCKNQLSYYRLLLKNIAVLKPWIHNIGRANLPLKDHTRVCSKHFANAWGRRLHSDEVPTLQLSVQCLHTKASFDIRLLPGNNLEVLLQLSTKMPSWTLNLLERMFNGFRTRYVKQKRRYKRWKRIVQSWKENGIFASTVFVMMTVCAVLHWDWNFLSADGMLQLSWTSGQQTELLGEYQYCRKQV